jgi:diguanylate cyclase (GGDEF)-like protein
MHPSRCKRVRWLGAVRAWPLWALPNWLAAFVLVVTVGYLAAIGAALTGAHITTHQLVLLLMLLGCYAATVELTRREGENAGLIVDVYGVWELPVAILLPPFYALVVPALRFGLNQWRVRRIAVHKRVFSAAITGLSLAGASVAFHTFTGTGIGTVVLPAAHPTIWVLAVFGAAVVQRLINECLLTPAIKGEAPERPISKLLLSRETLHNDIAEICVAVLVTSGIVISLLTIVFAFPLVTVLQRAIRHAFLVSASRLDSKTGLLNAGTWEREAASEVARAVRTRTPLALALIDVDHFKAVNDVHGHLAGDKALKEVARTLTVFLREYDLVGRFGGEEFALLLPQTKPVDAYRIAERIRAHIAAMPIDVDGGMDEPVRLTISIGVAALGVKWDSSTGGSQLTELLAAADSALYRAKQGGRDQVCVITENATFGAQSRTIIQPTRGDMPPAVPPPTAPAGADQRPSTEHRTHAEHPSPAEANIR